ncbi:MAG: sugar kinase, partial [Burkholderiaceae bacterium]
MTDLHNAAAKTLDLVAIGEPLIEFNQRDPTRPEFQMGFGGDTSNAVIAAARLGARGAYITQVGDDNFGASLLDLWQREGVATDGVRRVPGAPTGIYFVSHAAIGHEFTYRRAGSAASLMTPASLPRELLARAAQLHVSGISLAISQSACDTVFEALALARASGARVSFDLNHRPRLWSATQALDATRRVLPQCDLFLPSSDEVAMLTGIQEPEAMLRWAHDQGARAVILKLGAQGCIVSQDSAQTRLPAFHVTPVDATGAGDCFAGALLAQLARGATLVDAARVANVAAALSTLGFGAVAPLPRWTQVDAALQGRAG